MDILIATPTYDGRVSTGYARGLAETLGSISTHKFVPAFTRGSLVDRARDDLANNALRTGLDLLFIDADISFGASAVRRILEVAESHSDVGVISVPYPRRGTNGRIIFSVATIDGPRGEPGDDGVCAVNAVPAGFTLIRHSVLKRLSDALGPSGAPLLARYRDSAGFTALRFFPSIIGGDRLYGEDYSFCLLCKQVGTRIVAITGEHLVHEGEFSYSGAWEREAPSIW